LWLCLGSNEEITRARYRSGKGFLLHLAQTYDFMQPHLKGLHLAEDAWRPNRGLDGWKQSGADQWEDDVDYEDDEWSEEKLGFGKEEDLEALIAASVRGSWGVAHMSEATSPVWWPVRPLP
jgi:hypothetical protein